MSSRFRPARWLSYLLATVLLASCTGGGSNDTEPPADSADEQVRTPPILQHFDIGGDFVLAAHDGTEFDLAAHRGEVFLLFFGYTHCPDFCPATLSLLGQVYELLGEDGSAATTLFVTIDPERDTPAAMREYLEYFSVPALGLTGSAAELAPILQSYAGIMEMQEEDDGTVLFGHTTYTYLIDHNGEVRYMFRPDDTPRFIAAGVQDQINVTRGAQ